MISPGQNGTGNGATQNGTPHRSATPAGRGRKLVPAPDSTVDPEELDDLARELATAFGERVNSYRKHAKFSTEEAARYASQSSPAQIDRILNCPPDSVSWLDLDSLAQKDSGLALERWGQIKEAARNEIRIGYRATRAIEESGDPYERARYLAVRADLMEDWKPRNAVEKQLVDQLAQWQVLLWRWQEAMTRWTNCTAFDLQKETKGKPYESRNLSEAEALERATEKVERIHRLYIRTLKALQDQRRLRSPVAVRHAEQVNICPVRITEDNFILPSYSNESPP